MHKKIKNMLIGPVPKPQQKDFDKDIVRTYYWPILIVASITLLMEASMFLITIITPEIYGEPERMLTYRALYASLFLITLACLSYALIFRRKFKKRPNGFINIAIIYGFAICAWSSLLTAYGHNYSKDVTVFIYICLFVAILVVMKPWQAIIIYTVNFTIFCTTLASYGLPARYTFGSIANALVVSILSVIIATILYRSRAKNFLSRQTITIQKEKIQHINDQLKQLVLTDDLTTTHNRRYYEEVLPLLFNEARNQNLSIAVMMMDIDLFKQYNDIYGHPAGDNCLQKIVNLAREVMRSDDSFFIRYGGEEFLLGATGLTNEQAMYMANRVRSHIEKGQIPHKAGVLGCVTISIGVCMSAPGESTTLAQMVIDADKALYDAKNAGRNTVIMFEPNNTQN